MITREAISPQKLEKAAKQSGVTDAGSMLRGTRGNSGEPGNQAELNSNIELRNSVQEAHDFYFLTRAQRTLLKKFLDQANVDIAEVNNCLHAAEAATLKKLEGIGVSSIEEYLQHYKLLKNFESDPWRYAQAVRENNDKFSSTMAETLSEKFPWALSLEAKFDSFKFHRSMESLEQYIHATLDVSNTPSIVISRDKFSGFLSKANKESRNVFLSVAEELIKDYIADYLKKNVVPENPILFFLSGMPGAGKSSTYAEREQKSGVRSINIDPDEIKADLWKRLEQKGFFNSTKEAFRTELARERLDLSKFHEEQQCYVHAIHEYSTFVTKLLFCASLQLGLHTTEQGTATNRRRYVDMSKMAQNLGYDVQMVAVAISPAEALRRIVAERDRPYPVGTLLNAIRAVVTYRSLEKIGVPISVNENARPGGLNLFNQIKAALSGNR